MSILVIILILLILAHLVLWHYFPAPKRIDVTRCYDVGIVLGSPTREDGCLSRMQKSRMDAAIALYKEGRIAHILISGGSVRNAYAEADVMGAYAQKFVPETDIIVEDQARNTFENLKFAKAICDQKHWSSVIVITSCFHARRADYMVRKFFHDYAMGKTSEKEKRKHYLWEYFRMWNSLFYEIRLYFQNR